MNFCSSNNKLVKYSHNKNINQHYCPLFYRVTQGYYYIKL